MRNSKIVALVATAALLVLGATFTSMAATYSWYQVDGIWHCKDKAGDDYNQAFAKSGSDVYWLDENGEMATDLLLEEDGNYYYLDSDGKMVKNDWRKVENTDDEGDEYYWYYFQPSGKAIAGKYKPVSVTGKKYLFAEDGKMLYGWVGEEGATGDEDEFWKGATYYCGSEDDGAVRMGWQQLDVINEEEDLTEQAYWFYFGTNGKKVQAADKAVLLQKTINGKTYAFNESGAMVAEWEPAASTSSAASASISSYAWFHTVEDGSKLKKGWFRVIPTASVNQTANDDEEQHWFYAKGAGEIARNEVKTIGGKKYGFNSKGEMVSGLWKVLNIANVNGAFDDKTNCIDTETEVNALITGTATYNVYFFGDEETDGSMKTGTVTTEIDGDDYTFYFASTGENKYKGLNGWKKNAYYVNGSKLKGDADLRYQLFEVTDDPTAGTFGTVTDLAGIEIDPDGKLVSEYADGTNYVLVSSSGSFVKKATVKKDADGVKFEVTNYKATKKAE